MSVEDIRKIVCAANVVEFPDESNSKGGTIDKELSNLERNDYGNAQRLIRRYGNQLIHVTGKGWFVWDGRSWRYDADGMQARIYAHKVAKAVQNEVASMDVSEILKELVEQQRAPYSKAYEAAYKKIEGHRRWATASGNQARIRAMLTEAAPYISVSVKDLDKEDTLVSVGNGTLDLAAKGMETSGYVRLRPHHPDDKITALADVDFDANANAPLWDNFLKVILPDETLRLFVQRYFGYCLTGDQAEQCLCLFYGGGANGKSTLMDVIAEIMGDYSKTLPFASLLHDDKKRGGEASPDLARLPGARYVRASEPDAGVRFSESLIKNVTGGEVITTRMLNKDFFEFRPQFKLVLAFNNRPIIRGGDHGIWRRLMMVPFDVVIPKDEQDQHLKEKLLEEKSGILNWMLDGYRMWKETGLNSPDIVQSATQEYRDEQDPLRVFLSDCLIPHAGSTVQATRLYDLYGRWCSQNGYDPLKQAMFGRLVAERGFKKVKLGTYFYKDVAFSPSAKELLNITAV